MSTGTVQNLKLMSPTEKQFQVELSRLWICWCDHTEVQYGPQRCKKGPWELRLQELPEDPPRGGHQWQVGFFSFYSPPNYLVKKRLQSMLAQCENGKLLFWSLGSDSLVGGAAWYLRLAHQPLL